MLLFWSVLIALLSGGELLAQEPPVDELELSLDEALEQAISSNLELAVERVRRRGVELGIAESRGIYDLDLQLDVSIRDDTRPSFNSLEMTSELMEEEGNANLSLAQLLPLGSTLQLDFRNRSFESTSTFVNPNPFYQTELDLSVTQPLLRNRGRNATERLVISARHASDISAEDLEVRVSDLLQRVANQYWNLVEAREQLKVSLESLELARELHRVNEKQVEVGRMARVELLQSEAGLAVREEVVIGFEAAVRDNEDFLRELIGFEEGPLWERPLNPVTAPDRSPLDLDVAQAISAALAARPEARRQRIVVRDLESELGFRRNLSLPQLDLRATYGYNGLDGRRADDGVVVEGGYNDSLRQLTDGRFDGWSALLSLNAPLQNRAARSRRARAEVDLEAGELELRRLERQIQREVRVALRGATTAARRIASAEAAHDIARRNLEAEQKRYENGLSSSFNILRIQDDLTAASRREVQAVLTYRRALVGFYRATGRLLGESGVELRP